MKNEKLLEVANEFTTFGEVFDFTKVIYETKNHDFGFVFKNDSVVCEVNKVKKIEKNGKVEYEYKRVYSASSNNVVESFKNAVNVVFKK